MSKMKKAIAIVLVATMALGGTLTVSAAESTGSGETHGTGENEGHVDKELINVVLPTMPEEGSPFDYVTDPERLIKATAGARYEDYTFPTDNDTGVYFRVGEKEFANTSKTLQVINKSSCDVTITVTASVTASEGGKDLELATSSTTSADNPLYLNLKVGTTDQTISAGGTPVAKTIAGSPDNFEVQYTDGGYQYVTKAEAAYWQALNFSMNGAVFEGTVQAETTAPTVDVTWAFAKAADSASVDTSDQVQYEETAEPEIISISDFVKADPQDVVIKLFLGKGPGAVAADGVTLYQSAERKAVSTAKYSFNSSDMTVTMDKTAGFFASPTADIPVYVVLTQSGQAVTELTGTIKVKNDYSSAEIISITEFNKANPQDVVIKFSLGEKTNAVEADDVKLYQGASRSAVSTAKFSVNMSDKTITIDKTAGFFSDPTADIPVYIVLTKGGQDVKELTGTIKVK